MSTDDRPYRSGSYAANKYETSLDGSLAAKDARIKELDADNAQLQFALENETAALTALQQQFSWYDQLRAACNKQLIAMVPAGATINLATLTITIALLPEIEQEKP